jgi:hypothetical protein
LSAAHAALDQEIARTSDWHLVALAQLAAERAVIQELQVGQAWADALEHAISYVIGSYAKVVINALTWLTPAGLAIMVLRRLGVFGKLAQWSPGEWAACVTVTELRLAATVGADTVVFDVYGSWWGSRAQAPQKLVEAQANMPALDPYSMMEPIVEDIVKFLRARL